ncbi:Uncharacterised protein [Porphyromonas cangingivalis]|nr:Uncharacterised protein [Porphyromonas cangingivalis]
MHKKSFAFILTLFLVKKITAVKIIKKLRVACCIQFFEIGIC